MMSPNRSSPSTSDSTSQVASLCVSDGRLTEGKHTRVMSWHRSTPTYTRVVDVMRYIDEVRISSGTHRRQRLELHMGMKLRRLGLRDWATVGANIVGSAGEHIRECQLRIPRKDHGMILGVSDTVGCRTQPHP